MRNLFKTNNVFQAFIVAYQLNKRFVCRDNPREIRNKAEKQRRDKLNHSIAELASMVPPVVATNRKIDKTGILRLTAHYLRAHQYGKSLLLVSYISFNNV